MTHAILTSAPSVCRNMVKAREFAGPDALRAHYAAVNARLWAPRPAPAAPEAPADRSVEPVKEDERSVEPACDKADDGLAAQDALVFQVLDPAMVARTPRRIIADVARAHGSTYAEIVGASHTRRVVAIRWRAIVAVMEANPRLSIAGVGRCFNKDHTTILSALKRIRAAEERGGLPEVPAVRTAPSRPGLPHEPPTDILARIATAHGVGVEEIRGGQQRRCVQLARWAAIRAIRVTYPAMSSARIGAVLNLDRSTVDHALARQSVLVEISREASETREVA